MKKLHRARDFLAGAVVTLLLVAFILPAGAAQSAVQQIKVLVGGIDIYVDQQLKIPVDAQGNRVEPMVYKGTTYLPVRAISNMLGKEVTWDGATSSIYIGKAPSQGARGVSAEKLTRFSGGNEVVTGAAAGYKILGDQYMPANAIKFDYYDKKSDLITWKLDSDYQSIDGKFVLAYSKLGDDGEATMEFYNVDQYGTETLITSVTNRCGDGAVDVHVDVRGCNFVRIKFTTHNIYDNYAVFYDITATTMG